MEFSEEADKAETQPNLRLATGGEQERRLSNPSWPGLSRPSTSLSKTGTALASASMRGGWAYIVTNGPDGALYTGVTSDIARRAFEHREGLVDGFTRRYGLKRLVLTEFYEDIRDAIQRESNIKHWPRAWKVRLIHAANPDWRDLYEDLNG
jgi:putative endonuclease